MDRPTQEQIQRFWEGRGLEHKTIKYLPDKKELWFYNGHWDYEPPPIDLNNLVKYAVRELRERVGYVETVRLLVRWVMKFMKEGLDPALALFWALWQVKEGKG